MKIINPIFLKAIEDLKEHKPTNYQYKEVNLYNGGKDAVQQQISAIGNCLIVLDLPKYPIEIYIQFNERENEYIKVREGIILFDFYQIFLTYKHTDQLDIKGKPLLLRFLVGKDVISGLYPLTIEKSYLELSPGEYFQIPTGSGYYILPCKYSKGSSYPAPYSFDLEKRNQIRGSIFCGSSLGLPTYFYVVQFYLRDNATIEVLYKTKILYKVAGDVLPFIIDLFSPLVEFWVDKNATEPIDFYLYAKAWCL